MLLVEADGLKSREEFRRNKNMQCLSYLSYEVRLHLHLYTIIKTQRKDHHKRILINKNSCKHSNFLLVNEVFCDQGFFLASPAVTGTQWKQGFIHHFVLLTIISRKTTVRNLRAVQAKQNCCSTVSKPLPLKPQWRSVDNHLAKTRENLRNLKTAPITTSSLKNRKWFITIVRFIAEIRWKDREMTKMKEWMTEMTESLP